MTWRGAWRVLSGAPGARRTVPPSPGTSRLMIFSSAAMAFLGVIAIALAIALTALSQSWRLELAESATLRITAGTDTRGEAMEAALHVLATTPGVDAARVISDLEQAALLEPWFGRDIPVGDLPLPQLIAITPSGQGFDADALRLRLAGEVPDAVLDTHARWRAPLALAEQRLRWVTAAGLGLIAGTLAAVTALAAQAALWANTQSIDVLRQVGAKDGWIASAFVRRLTWQSTVGALVGTCLSIAVLLSLPPDGVGGLPSLRPTTPWAWATLALLPPFVAGVAFVSSRRSAMRLLRGRAP
ncbi:MAG: cell division protein FtsX [Pseudomonadota bacterium]